MYSSKPNLKNLRKDTILELNSVLLKLDNSDFTGNVHISFCNKKGITGWKIEKFDRPGNYKEIERLTK